jgi:hypothetical protein
MVQRYSFFTEYEVSMVFWGENSPSSLHKKWCEVTQNDSFLIVINLIYNIVFFQGQNRAENRKIDLDYFFCDAEKDESGLFVDDPELLALTKEMFHEFTAC